MMKFVLVGFKSPNVARVLGLPPEHLFKEPVGLTGYPVYDAVHISEDLIFGRDD